MKKIITLSTLLLLLLAFANCNGQGKSARYLPHIGDTPYQEDSILVTYAMNPDRALVMLDSAIQLGNVNDYRAQFLRAVIYTKSLNGQHQDSARLICEALLQHDSVKNNSNNYEDVLNLLMNISRLRGDDTEFVHWSTVKTDLLRAQGEEVELLRTEAEIGLVMTHLGQTEEGIAMINHSIEALDEPGSVDRMDAFIIAVKRMITVLSEMNRQSEVIPLAERVLDRLDHFEQHAADYAEDSYRLSWSDHPSDRSRYMDFSRAQANGFLAIAYAATGNREKALNHLKAFDNSDYGKTFSARCMIIPAQMALGMYDEAMATSKQQAGQMGADTVNVIYANILRYRALAARQRGDTEKAYNLMNRHAILAKLLSDSIQRSDAHAYAVRYHVKEQQLQIQQAESERRQMMIILIAVAVLLVITLFAALYFLHQHHLIVKKNRALVRMIDNAHLPPLAGMSDDFPFDDEEAPATEERADGEDEAEKEPDPNYAELFATIDATIRKEHLYKKTGLQRQDICRHFGISRVTLNNMLQQERGNASLPQYINAIRIEEVIRLLRDEPDMSIAAIAESVGFSPANLRKQFINIFGMTPMEYRQNK